MTVVNLDRDMFWTGQTSQTSLPSTSTAFGANPSVKNPNNTYVRHGDVSAVATAAGTATEFYSMGVRMQWGGNVDAIPFHVIGTCNHDCTWYFGWSNLATAETSFSLWSPFAYGKSVDTILCVNQYSSWVSGINLYIYGSFAADAGDTIFALTAQSLIGKPDQYSSAVR